MLFMAAADVLTWIQTLANGGVLILQATQMGLIIGLMNKITDGAWLLTQARKFCIEFDQILVKYSEKVYGYFTDIVGGTLLTPEIVNDLMSRVYIIVGLFIFFKLAMVAMKYMVNPEQFVDDKLGAQTLVKRVILGSLIIILIPIIFSTANRLQKAIIQDRVIEKIILPGDAYEKLVKGKNTGRSMAMLVFRGFFSWNKSIKPDEAKIFYNKYNKVIKYDDLTLLDKDLINEEKDGKHVIEYVPIISTLAVGYLLFMLIKYAMEVAFRSFKLVFLQVLSPFVIVNYMLDPSKEEVMKKWVNSTVSTYLLIFIRVMTIWFATLICYYFTNGVGDDGTSLLRTDQDQLLKALIILAVFAFLKDLPKLISEIFGYNLQENETIGGIMNQGVGILKGFAIGKVAMGVTKGLRATSMATSGISAASGAVGGASKGLANSNGLGKLATTRNVLNSSTFGMGAGMSTMTSVAGSALSSAMGQSILSPIAQTASASSHAAQLDERQQVISAENSLGHKSNKNQENYKANDENESRRSETPNLSTSNSTITPIINNRNEINSNLQNSNNMETIDREIAVINQFAQQDAIHDVEKSIHSSDNISLNNSIVHEHIDDKPIINVINENSSNVPNVTINTDIPTIDNNDSNLSNNRIDEELYNFGLKGEFNKTNLFDKNSDSSNVDTNEQ